MWSSTLILALLAMVSSRVVCVTRVAGTRPACHVASSSTYHVHVLAFTASPPFRPRNGLVRTAFAQQLFGALEPGCIVVCVVHTTSEVVAERKVTGGTTPARLAVMAVGNLGVELAGWPMSVANLEPRVVRVAGCDPAVPVLLATGNVATLTAGTDLIAATEPHALLDANFVLFLPTVARASLEPENLGIALASIYYSE